jgi:hypothetical protein
MFVLYDHAITLDKEVWHPSFDPLFTTFIPSGRVDLDVCQVHSIPRTISDSILKAAMATAKDYIPHKSLLPHFADCVRRMVYLPSSLKITCSIDRLTIVRECHIV